MADFDIEAYLEEQVSKGKDENKEKVDNRDIKKREDDHDSRRRRDSSRDRRDRRRSSRDRRSRSRSYDRRRDDRRDRNDREHRDRRDRRDGSRERDDDKKPLNLELKPSANAPPAPVIEDNVDDVTKDQRTVFVGQLTMKVVEANLREFFSQIGTVKNIILVRDKFTGKHKGFGYVEMADLQSIPHCLLFNNVVPDFQKFPILVRPSEAEKNYVAKKDVSSVEFLDPRIYIGNLHVNITDDALKSVVEQFGPVETVSVQRDDYGVSKGYAFVRYLSGESAKMAFAGLSGMELVGRPLKVGPVLDGSRNTLSGPSFDNGKSPTIILQTFNDMHVSGPSAPSGGGQLATNNWQLDDDDGSRGMQLTSQSRQLLMAKLGAAAGIQVPVTVTVPIVNPQTIAAASNPTGGKTSGIPPIGGNPNRAIIIRNMFDPATETGAHWDDEIREDVTEECSKCGVVEHVYVEKIKPGGIVYVKFSNIDACMTAAQNLNGRYFAGKMITVSFMDPYQYDTIVFKK